ncbi:putative sugar dehydratase/epimerase [Wickerhamomyces ciferrii]|uniref:Sugar dehydratase/epimerase n=1 Tax=Wickerhamomyces ciferrii (strain ATCC 14091 / BCRC 22168 / CBS 111 / JCM 3599 / NBRC 0793 / NRRL Y-1031 F-60-10) TaxID=1206466 RepID=K0KM68_WICCF|nr:putative sugar dehydratase/epimerase [Wickerhamomyces ciferrii]CCH44091.1 putative sugar dehydratase/epimerase [Wickerhamomyces ciferrii]
MTKFFVTGGSGFIGSEVVDELLSHGHEVLALARSDKSAEQLKKKGAQVLRGTIEDLDILKTGAKETDATKAIANVLEGTGKLFIWTSGLGGLPTPIGIQSTEDDKPDVDSAPKDVKQRLETEHYVLDASKRNIKTIVIRLSPIVHGENDHAFIPFLTKGAKDNGAALYNDEGKSTWPAIHKKDAGVLYRLAAEKGQAGKAYHGAAESGIDSKLIAEAIGKKVNVGAKSTNIGDLGAKLGFIGIFFGTNINSSSEKTRKELGWEPKQLGLLEDIEKNYQ